MDCKDEMFMVMADKATLFMLIYAFCIMYSAVHKTAAKKTIYSTMKVDKCNAQHTKCICIWGNLEIIVFMDMHVA